MKKFFKKIKEALMYKSPQEAYLSKAQDIYDLERRMKEIEAKNAMVYLGLRGRGWC